MAEKDRYSLGGHSFAYSPGGSPQAAAAPYDAYHQFHENRDHYRRETELIVGPSRAWALANHTAAIDLAQSALKASTLINVGGFVAIQAAVPLFKLEGVGWQMLGAATWFAVGLFAAWLSYGFGFHALAHGADQATSEADAANYLLLTQYHPTDPNASVWGRDKQKAQRRARRLRWSFVILRAIAVLLFWGSAIAFFGGAWNGVCVIVGGLPPPSQPSIAWPFQAICGRWIGLLLTPLIGR